MCVTGNITSTGQIVAQTINVQQVTSSIVYSCGSNTFGCSTSNNQVFTGSVFITGSNIDAKVINTCFSGQVCSNTLSVASTSTFGGCLNVNTGNQIRLYNSAKNNWTQIEAPLVSGDAAIDFKLTTQTGVLYVNSTGIACFNNTICTPNLVVNKSNPVLYINSGNNETSTIGFTQGAVSGYGGFIKVGTGLGDRSMTFGLSAAGTNNDATELIRLDDSGVTCFSNTVCTTQFISTVSSGTNLELNKSTGPSIQLNKTGATAQTWQISTDPSFRIIDSTASSDRFTIYTSGIAYFACQACFGGNVTANGAFNGFQSGAHNLLIDFSAESQVTTLTNTNLFFGTNAQRRTTIFSSGITCFACQVCAPNFIASSTCSTAGLRTYGASGTHLWDMYLNGANLRFSDNTSGGYFVVDTAATFGGYVGLGASTPLTKLHLYDSSPNYILLTNTGADGVSNAIQGGIIGQSRGYSNNLAQMANILFRNKNTAAWYKGEISFSTNDSDGTNPAVSAVERMRIFSDGVTCLSNTFCTPQLYLQQDSNSEVQFLSANNQNCTGTSSAARIDVGTWINQYALTLGRNGICTTGTRFGDNQANTTFIFDNAVSSCGMYIGLATSTGNLNLITAGTKRLVITSNGYVGIGTSCPNISGGLTGNAILTMKATANSRVAILELNGCRDSNGDNNSYIMAFNNSCTSPFGVIRFNRGTVDGCGSITLSTSGVDRMVTYANGATKLAYMDSNSTTILQKSFSVSPLGCTNICFDIVNEIPGKGNGYVIQADIHVGGYGSAGASGLLYKASVAGYDGHYVGLGAYHKDAELVKCASGVDIKIYNPSSNSNLLGVTIYNCSGTYGHTGTLRMILTY
jgi:hypothetical protein